MHDADGHSFTNKSRLSTGGAAGRGMRGKGGGRGVAFAVVACMAALIAFVRAIDKLNGVIGQVVGWWTLGTVLVCAAVVLLRYVVNVGFIWLQDLYVWVHAAVFTLGAGYTLMRNGHVRVDILYARWSARQKAKADLFGTLLLLLPWLAVTGYAATPYVIASWETQEASFSAGGMPGVFVLKTVLLLFCLTLGLQGLAVAARCILVLRGREEYQHRRPDEAPSAQ